MRAGKSLTLNLGAAYAIMTPQTEGGNRMSDFDPVTGPFLVAGQNAGRTTGINTDWTWNRGSAPHGSRSGAPTPWCRADTGSNISFRGRECGSTSGRSFSICLTIRSSARREGITMART